MKHPHLIGREIWEIRLDASKDAFSVQQQLSTLNRDVLTPAMERLFDQWVGQDRVWNVDRVVIDLGRIQLDPTGFKVMVNRLLVQLQEQLEMEKAKENPSDLPFSTSPVKGNVVGRPVEVHHFDQWIYWLQHGSLPSYSTFPEADWMVGVLATLASESTAVDRLQNILHRHQTAMQRLVLQHGESHLQSISELFTGHLQTDLLTFFVEVKKLYRQTDARPHVFSVREMEVKSWIQIFNNTILLRKKWDSEKLLKKVIQQKGYKELIGLWMDLEEAQKENYVMFPRFWETKDLKEYSDWKRTETRSADDVRKIESEANGSIQKDKTPSADEKTVAEKKAKKSKQDLANETIEINETDNDLTEAKIGVSKKNNDVENPDETFSQLHKNKEQREEQDTESESKEEDAALSMTSNPEEQQKEPDSPQFLTNAGMVLLHPFIGTVFKKLGWVAKGEFIGWKERCKGVLLWHFLATGNDKIPEYDLVLPKFLCEMPANRPLDHTLRLSKKEKKEANLLLQAAIDHWGALGNTSPDGLREGFLMREGKLAKEETGWKLYVEQKAQDILLDRLPWNLSLLKLPWMKEILRVEWR